MQSARLPNQIIAAPPGHPDLCNMALQFPPEFRDRVLALAPDAQIVTVESLGSE